MARKTLIWAMFTVVLAWQPTASADSTAPAGHESAHHCERGWSCQRIWAWLTYRPLPVPKEFRRGPVFVQTATPPYYTYFLYMYGPRSPALGFPPRPAHHGGHCEHGLPSGVYANPPGLDIPLSDEMLPAPGLQAPASSSSLPDPEPLPGQEAAATLPTRDTAALEERTEPLPQ